MAELTAAEANRREKVHGFSVCRCGGHWVSSWVHTRGRFPEDSPDGGSDLLVLRQGAHVRKVITGSRKLSAAVWSPDAAHFVVHSGQELVLGHTSGLRTERLLRLPDDETFIGLPVWVGVDVVLFATTGGSPECNRLHAVALPPGSVEKVVDDWVHITFAPEAAPGSFATIFTGKPCAYMLTWDHSPIAPLIALVHQRTANAVADVVLVPGLRKCQHWRSCLKQPHVIAMEGSVEYSRPQVTFLSDGRLVARLNLAHSGKLTSSTEFLGHSPASVTHGLWLLEPWFRGESVGCDISPVHVVPGLAHGSYDVCSGSYCHDHGVREGFIIGADRHAVVVAARPQALESLADGLFVVKIPEGKVNGTITGEAIAAASMKSKGCYVPLALHGDMLVFHFRSPVEWGDLWYCDMSRPEKRPAPLTCTMKGSLQKKLARPEEVVVPNPESGGALHALLYQPRGDLQEDPAQTSLRQPLVWAHGGPALHYSYDYNPFLSWLASLGYVVLAPNFRGSTGFGVEFMHAVLGDGCGVADVSDCAACVAFLRALERRRPELRLDLSRGVAAAGHSWGGYLALMCLLSRTDPASRGADAAGQEEPLFSCAVASAAITDWAVQQSETWASGWTTHSLLGGCVQSDSATADRAGRVAPASYAAGLRGPLLMLHGEEDVEVPFEQTRRFVEAARRSPHPRASLMCVAYPGECHGMRSWSDATQEDALRQISNFLRKHLKRAPQGRQQPPPSIRRPAPAPAQPQQATAQDVGPSAALKPPLFREGGYAPSEESGWEHAHAGGQWLFSEAEGLYLHLPTGKLVAESASRPCTFNQPRGGQPWRVVGGKETGGILVRTGREFDSPKAPQRLAVDALVVELELEGERLRYRRLAGDGPATGWVSTRVGGKELLVKVEPGLRDVEGGEGFGKRLQLRVAELFEEALDLEWSLSDCEEDCGMGSGEARLQHASYRAAVDMVLVHDSDDLVVESPGASLRPPKGSFVKRVDCDSESHVTIFSMPEGRSFLVSVLLAFEGRGRLRSPWARASTLDPARRPHAATSLDPTGTRRAKGVVQRCEGFVDYGREAGNSTRKVRCRRCGADYDTHEVAYGG